MEERSTGALSGGERAALQEALALPGYRLLKLSSGLEESYSISRQALAVDSIRQHWRIFFLGIVLIALLAFATDLVDDRMSTLVMIGFTVILALIGMVAAGSSFEVLHPHIDKLVAVAAFIGLFGMHIGVVVSPAGGDLRSVSEYGAIFITIALFTVSGLSFQQATLVASVTLLSLLVLSVFSPEVVALKNTLGGPAMLDPLFVEFSPDWHRFPFYGLGSLIIGGLLGVSHDMRERRVFLQERLLVHEKHELDQLSRELTLISREDALTRLANRRHFDEVFAREWSGSLREGMSMNLVFVDVDYFKRYNDHYGHQAGDECLARVAGALATQAKRGADFVARYGGEEFVAFFPRTNNTGLAAIAQRMIDTVDELGIPHAASDAAPHVTISVGIAAITPLPGMTSETLLQAADAALYKAKQAGRHRYVAAWTS